MIARTLQELRLRQSLVLIDVQSLELLANERRGVADRVDLAPFVKSGLYGESNPLLLNVENLTGNNSSNAVPTFVDFQLRPQSPDQLQFSSSFRPAYHRCPAEAW